MKNFGKTPNGSHEGSWIFDEQSHNAPMQKHQPLMQATRKNEERRKIRGTVNVFDDAHAVMTQTPSDPVSLHRNSQDTV